MITLNHFLYTNLYILLFWGFYKLVLHNEKQFRNNRIILMLSVPVAMVLPFGHQTFADYLASYQTLSGTPLSKGLSIMLQELTVRYNTDIVETTRYNYPTLLLAIGSTLTLLWTLAGHFKIVTLIRSTQAEHISNNKVNISAKSVVPFSYFKSIVIPQSTPAAERHMVVLHESYHIKFMHYIDTYLLQILQVIFWMNPFFYLLKRELKQVHEYEVDQQVISSGIDAINYKVTLVKFSIGSPKFLLANGLTNYPLKKRLIMMNNSNQKQNTWKYMLLFPVLALSFAAISSCTSNSVDQPLETSSISTNEVETPITNDSKMPEVVVVSNKNETGAYTRVEEDENGNPVLITKEKDGQEKRDDIFMVVEKMPQFIGGNKALMNYLGNTTKYPVSAQENGIQGRVYVSFIVANNGAIVAPKIIRGVDPSLDAEALRVVNSMPDWAPGTQRGKNVNVRYTLPINFVLQ